ncbi:hypothetical protein M422DRAFT_149082 [Sphaerobolus stellatus SS14]|nr:hypothetical protein M422DRAFT_149082 [Sphaerobolus stellatus SS14]
MDFPVDTGTPFVFYLHSNLNPTSPHKVLYQNKLYPTAAHLFEAHKFLQHKPELAERIRVCSESASEMSMLSWEFQSAGHVRDDWELVWREKLDEVLYLMFTQHPNLRAELMATGYAQLVDGNEARPHGVVDAPGINELGKGLMRVRERLRSERARAR